MPSPYMRIQRAYYPPGVVNTAYIDNNPVASGTYLSNNRPFRSTLGSYLVTSGAKPSYTYPPGSTGIVYNRYQAPQIPFIQVFPSSP